MATTRRNQQPDTPQAAAPAIAAVGLLVGLVVLWFGYPGVTLAWLMVTVAAWVAPPAVFTGKKDASGYPTPAHAGERASMQRYRFWADLKWRLMLPAASLAPGWPPYAAWVFGLLGATAAWCLPHTWMLGRHLDAAAAFILLTQVAAARRKTVAVGDVSPGVRFDTLAKVRTASKEDLVPGAVAVVIGTGLGAYLAGGWLPAPPLPAGGLVWWVLGGLLGAGAGGAKWWTEAALADWRELVAARAEWEPRWQMLKHDPAPFLMKREHVGAAVVDTFAAPGSMGAMAYWLLGPKISPTLGAGQRLAVLSVPNTDSQDQPVPGTRHPLNFQVVVWPSDALPDLASPDTDPEIAALFIQCAVVWACDATGYARPILNEATPLAVTVAEPEESADGEPATAAPGSPTQAWGTTWLLPDGPPFVHLRTSLLGDITGQAGCEVLVDHRTEVMYLGSLTSGQTVFDPSTGIEEEALRLMSVEDVWNARWAEVMKQGVNPPTISHPAYAEASLSNGTVVHRQPFVTRKGVDPQEFFGLEAKIAATLDGAPYVAVCGWLSQGRIGERHPQAFTVYWSDRPVPANPDTLPPTPEPSDAPQWVLSGRINEAFKAARLAKPEVYNVTCLTAPRSRGHIWQMRLRLYGGVTLADVRGAAQRIRQHLGSEWLRVKAADDGCVIVAGVSPQKARLVNPQVQHDLAALDWEQAFLDVKLVGQGGMTPTLTNVSNLPDNQKVQVLDFDLPAGISLGQVKTLRAKLESSTENAFVEPRPHPDRNPSHMQLFACETNPMPEKVGYQFDYESDMVPFATGVEGKPVEIDFKTEPHLLIAGTSGGGKSVTAQCVVYSALTHGMQVVIVDAQKMAADFRFAEDRLHGLATDIFEAEATMKAVYAESKRRAVLNGQHGVGHVRDLPEPPPPMLVFLDEFLGLIMAGSKPPTRPEENLELEKARLEKVRLYQARKQIGFLAGRIAAESRSSDIHLVLATQKLINAMLDDDLKDLKTNMARILLGRANSGERMSALRDAEAAPPLGDYVPRGRGIWESTMHQSQAVQFWFATPEEYREKLVERVPEVPQEDRIDISGFLTVPDPADQAVLGEVIGSSPSPTTAPKPTAPDRVIELGEIEFSLDDLELDDEDDAAEAEVADPAPQPSAPPEIPGFDWDAAEAAAVSADPTEAADDLDWSQAAEVSVDPAPEQTVAEVPADGVEVGEHTVWDEVDPSPWEPVESEYGWTEIDAVVAFLTDYPHVRTVTWADPHLADENDMGVAFVEIVADLLSFRGVTLDSPALAAPAPVEQAPPPEPAPASTTAPAPATTSNDDDDEFSLPRVAAHLIPDDNPFD